MNIDNPSSGYREKLPPSEIEISIDIDNKILGDENPGLTAAEQFAYLLKDSVKNSKFYKDDESKVTPLIKWTHDGWSEHNSLKHFFNDAVSIRSEIKLWMTRNGKKNYRVKVIFKNKDGKDADIETFFDEDGNLTGGIGASHY